MKQKSTYSATAFVDNELVECGHAHATRKAALACGQTCNACSVTASDGRWWEIITRKGKRVLDLDVAARKEHG